MNCPTNTYNCCNSCCSNPCGCKKSTTTSTTTMPIIPCNVTNCEQVIDIQCIVHNLNSDCLVINNDNLLDVIASLFHKLTGECCGQTTTTTSVNLYTTTSTTINITTTL